MKSRLISIVIVLIMGGFLSISHTHAKPLTIRVGYDLPPFTTPGMGIKAWADEVNAKTDGRVVVEVYPSSTLSDQQAGIDMLHAGVADVYLVSFGRHRRLFPVLNVHALPGLGFPDTAKGHKANSDTLKALIDKYPVMAKELKDFVMIYEVISSNSILLSAKKRIRTPNDIRGLKVGGVGIRLQLIKMMGGAGIFDTPGPGAYQKLQTGVVDATTIHYLAMGEFKLQEVSKYALEVFLGQGGLPLLMSRKTWNKLSAKDQQIIMEAGRIGEKVTYEAGEKLSIKGRKDFLDHGNTITIPTAEEMKLWEKQLSVIWNKWVSDMKAAGVANADDILNDWKRASDKAWGR
jgi:TRAP-type C4-dicarboxylate transport system substrate-binding protein